ncbi:MAG TPA: hypothetical protein EYG80_05320 [Flavobacteriaceae bacterium]|nr:hypothetical protein [Flavobacteriaceae bacterium]
MTEVKVKFKNCYGINELEYTFDFTDKKVYSIYAPNGAMKTSFAKTFKDLSLGVDSKDLMFPEKETLRSIQDETGMDILSDNIFVIESYKEQFETRKVSTLLVNNELKTRYEDIHESIDGSKEELLTELKILSGLSKRSDNIEKEISDIYGQGFFTVLEELEETITEIEEAEYPNIVYHEIFNSKVMGFLKTEGINTLIIEYIEKYNELLSESLYFKPEFNLTNAVKIQKQLEQNKFFTAGHSVNMFDGENDNKISNQAELESLIKAEKEEIFTNKRLQDIYAKIDTKIKNKELEQFRDYLLLHQEILPELGNLDEFSKKLWLSYFFEKKELYLALLVQYRSAKEEINEIIASAKDESTAWENVVEIFNKRFSVSFSLKINNQDDVILKDEVPSLGFIFKNLLTGEEIEKTKSELFEALSLGERRAFYLLNIIFEVEVRKESRQETLFIIDDIADSFDYKNKYAIIEYLKDITSYDYFSQIILTHNFDFYRTICSRFYVKREKRLNVLKNIEKIELIQEKYQNNPFLHWKDNLETNNIMMIATIPFVRNLAEYCMGKDSNEYTKLTSLLHIKNDTLDIKISDLETIYCSVLTDKQGLTLSNRGDNVIDLIYTLSNKIMNDGEEIMELETKIVLALGIRLKTEQFMINKINNQVLIDEIYARGKAQFIPIFNTYKISFSVEIDNIQLIEQVNLMTPENIHLNSFMYEPILDMSNEHLKTLYRDVNLLSV